MSIDSDIQAMIDASIPPSPDLSGIQSTLATLAATVADQEVRIAALEGTTPPPPPSGLPVIPSGLGSKLRVVPAVDGMGPFGIFRYPDDHIGGSGQLMTVYTRYSNAYNGVKAADGSDLVSVHDGFIELRCVKRPDGLFDGAYIGSAGPKRGGSGTFTASPTATIRWWLQFSKGQAVWPTAWLYDVLKWSANEIDWPEEYGGKIHGNLHPGSAGISVALPSDCDTAWHEYRMDWTASGCTFYIDGTKVGTASGAVAGPMALVADAKIGLDTPNSSTPSATFLRIAGVTVE